jgi:hypothetical protein
MKEKIKKNIIRIVGILLAALTIFSAFSSVIYVFAASTPGTKYITVTKKIIEEDINWDNGNPVFTYDLEGVNTGAKFQKNIEFTKSYVNQNKKADGTIVASITFENLASDQYLLREQDCYGFETTKVSDITNGVAYDSYWTEINGEYIEVKRFEIEFNLNKESFGTATFEGIKAKHVIVTKELVAADINWANGNPIFIYELETPDASTNGIREYKVIEFTKEYVEAHTEADGTVKKSITFENLPSDQYFLREMECIRFKTTKVYNIKNGESYDSYWTEINGEYVEIERFEVEFNLNKERIGEATFNAVKTKWSDASHTDYIINEFKS